MSGRGWSAPAGLPEAHSSATHLPPLPASSTRTWSRAGGGGGGHTRRCDAESEGEADLFGGKDGTRRPVQTAVLHEDQDHAVHKAHGLRQLVDQPLVTIRRGTSGAAPELLVAAEQQQRSAPPPPPPPRVTFRLVVAPLRGPGQSPILPFAYCVRSLLSVGRCSRRSCWCRFCVRGAQ